MWSTSKKIVVANNISKNLDFVFKVNQDVTLQSTVSQPTGVNFINVLCTAFGLVDPKSVKNTAKSSVSFYAFGIYECKSCTWNVDEIDTWAQFNQRSTYSFYTRRSQKRKKYS